MPRVRPHSPWRRLEPSRGALSTRTETLKKGMVVVRVQGGMASILLSHLSLLIPDPLSSCSIECVRPVRVHVGFPIWQLSFLLCPRLHHRGSEGFPNQLCSDICRHCTRL